MDEIVKHINDTNASYRQPNAGDAKNTDLFLDNEHYAFFEGAGEHVTVRFFKENLSQAILFIASILPRKFDQSATHCIIEYSSKFVIDQLAIIDALFKLYGKSVDTITQVWNARKNVVQKNGKIDNRFYFNGLMQDVVYLDSTGEERKAKFTVRNYMAGEYSELHIKKAEDGIFDIEIKNVTTPYNDGKEDDVEEILSNNNCLIPLQQIFYGAPGTGKSHSINELTAGKDVIRTTFHPDTDYSTFVGAYKPTTKPVPVITVIGTEAVPVRDKNGKEMKEDKIVYEYVSQAFLQAYVAAWKKYCDVQEGEEPMDEFLVIEEINRGNCAQIFGDLFQLLDRGDEGFSEYPIKADSDMKKLLEKEFEGLEIKNKEGINALFNGGKDIVAEVLAGDVLLLPNNLYIWATMNTSDQSLFPIDSAFKRRWDWNYVPISDAGKKWMIEVNGVQYDWWNFLEAINDKVYHATYSEDKKLGYFFCKAKDGVISADKFVSKVIFYLWNDVFKDSEFEGDTFKDEDGEKLSFDKFYSVENNQVKVNGTKIVKFLSNLNLEPDSEADEDNSEEGFETEGDKKLPKTSKVFSVEFPDGTVINENNKFDTYHKTLSKIGIEQVEKIAAEMKYHRLHTPLVTKSKYEVILNKPEYSYIQEGDCFIVKGINNITMYRMVMLLDNRLDLQLKVCYE